MLNIWNQISFQNKESIELYFEEQISKQHQVSNEYNYDDNASKRVIETMLKYVYRARYKTIFKYILYE